MSDGEFIRHPHQLRERSRAHLAHNLAPMDPDGDLAGAQLAGSLLIRKSGNHERKHFAFAGREQSIIVAKLGQFRALLAALRDPQPGPRRWPAIIPCSPNGFRRNSIAPAFMARTEEGTSPWPVMKMIGGASPPANSRWSSSPLTSRKLQIQDQGRRARRAFRIAEIRQPNQTRPRGIPRRKSDCTAPPAREDRHPPERRWRYRSSLGSTRLLGRVKEKVAPAPFVTRPTAGR